MKPELCKAILEETSDQSSKSEWYYQRYARITASKLFECSRCLTEDGSLVSVLMGARSFKGNRATKRGQKLEVEVLDLLRKKYPTIKKCGIFLSAAFPIFGASPDGICDDCVFEIKCPYKEKTVANYIDKEVVKPKVFFQMQLQMFMSGKKKGVLAVADPDFEKNKKFTTMEVPFDEIQLKPVMKKAELFWQKAIFPILS